MIRSKLQLIKSRVKDVVEFLRTGSIYDVTVAEPDTRYRRVLAWCRSKDVRETGSYLEVFPFFGHVPQTVLVIVDREGNTHKMGKGSTAERLRDDCVYLGPLPQIPPEWEIPI